MRKDRMMRGMFKSGFIWQFVGGFALGAVALVSLHPAATASAKPQTSATR